MFTIMHKLYNNLCIGTSGKPSPTDIEETFVLYFVGDGFLHVPKRYLYINLKFGIPFYPYKPTYILDLRVEALDLQNSFIQHFSHFGLRAVHTALP